MTFSDDQSLHYPGAGDPVAPEWRRVVEPQSAVVSPVTVAELAEFLEDPCPPDSGSSRESLYQTFLDMATDTAIRYMDRELKERQIVTRFDQYPRAHSSRGRLGRFSGGFEFFAKLPRVPVMELQKVERFDEDGNAETIEAEDYDFDGVSEPARLHLEDPPIRGDMDYFAGIRVTYKAGYADDEIPAALKLGIQMLAAYYYEKRGDDSSDALTKSGARTAFDPYRILTGL